MSKSKIIWIPAGLACLAAILLMAYSYHLHASHPFEGGGTRRAGGLPHGEEQHPFKGAFATLGTVSLYAGAINFSWFWFKRKMKSPSPAVRKAGKLLYAVHKRMGWGMAFLIAVHGVYFAATEWNDDKVYSGLAACVLLLAIAAYGSFIGTVRNKWMRSAHRWVSVAWVPVLFLHAGGSVLLAVLASLGIYGTVRLLELGQSAAR